MHISLVHLVVINLLADITITASYLSGVKHYQDFQEFFFNEVNDYKFDQSLFELWILSLVRSLFICLFIRVMPKIFYLGLFLTLLIYTIVKTAAFDFEHGFGSQFLVIIFWILAVVLELFAWFKFDATKPLPGYMPIGNSVEASHVVNFNSYESRANSISVTKHEHVTSDSDSEYMSAEEDEDGQNEPEINFTNVGRLAAGLKGAQKPVNLKRPLSDFDFPENVTYEEEEKLAHLRVKFPDAPDERLLRFLRGRDGNVANATIMLRDHEAFRIEYNLDELDFSEQSPVPIRGYMYGDVNGMDSPGQWEAEQLGSFSGTCVHKWTRAGMPLIFLPLGSSDSVSVGKAITRSMMERNIFASIEFIGNVLIPELALKNGRVRPSIVLIIDVKGLGLRQFYMPTLRLFRGLFQKIEDNYPESLYQILIINTPAIFKMFWSVIMPFLPVRTLSRIRIIGTDYQDQVNELVAPENLPYYLGGLCSCCYPGRCIPYPITPGYEDPHVDAEQFYKSPVLSSKFAFHHHPIAITKTDLRRWRIACQKQQSSLPFRLSWVFIVQGSSFVSFSILFLHEFDTNYLTKPDLATLQQPSRHSPNEQINGMIDITQSGLYVLRWAIQQEINSNATASVRYKIFENE